MEVEVAVQLMAWVFLRLIGKGMNGLVLFRSLLSFAGWIRGEEGGCMAAVSGGGAASVRRSISGA